MSLNGSQQLPKQDPSSFSCFFVLFGFSFKFGFILFVGRLQGQRTDSRGQGDSGIKMHDVKYTHKKISKSKKPYKYYAQCVAIQKEVGHGYQNSEVSFICCLF